MIGEDDEARQIVGEAAEAITEPRAQTGETGIQKPGVLQVARGPVDVGLRPHRHQKGHLIDFSGHVREHITHPAA
jgi:hypothetical protein